MSRHNRRVFLKRSIVTAGAGAAFAISGTKSSGRVLGANDRVRIAVAGLNGRGGSHVQEFSGIKGVEIAYLIDPDTRTFGGRLKQVAAAGGAAPQTVQDARQALDDKNLDAISIATPNHWHTLLTIWGCQAGKDVYVEKPCSHNVHEGRMAVEAARHHQRIVQHGTQSRSSGSWAGAIEFVKSGQAGKLLISRGLCYKPRGTIGMKSPKDPPSEVDFNLWLGPAPSQPYHENLVHYNWHWFWDTGNGDIGNQGVHQMDIARWVLPDAAWPKSVISFGGRFGYKDQGQTANTQVTVFDYGLSQLIFEVRGLPTDKYRGESVGNLFHCEGGMVTAGRFQPKDSEKSVKIPAAPRGPGSDGEDGGHFANFIAAVRSRNQGDLNAPILEGHLSSALCHLANMSYRLGPQTPFEVGMKTLGEDKGTNEALERMQEHLSRQGVHLKETQLTLGRKLTIDPQTEGIMGDSEASRLLTRVYRQGFAVPEKIG